MLLIAHRSFLRYAAPWGNNRTLLLCTVAIRSHYSYSGPGSYEKNRQQELEHAWSHRNFEQRGFTVGIGGPVGSGKTALTREICKTLQSYNLGVVTNDIFTQEDAEFLVRHKALPANRIRAVETGGCPHAAIREDTSANQSALEDLTQVCIQTRQISGNPKQEPLLLCESGGDNLAANFSRELADLTLYVIDVAGGDKVPRKGGPGITQSDLLIINKIDLADAVGADLNVMERDASKMRGTGPTIFASVKNGTRVPEICAFIVDNFVKALTVAGKHVNK